MKRLRDAMEKRRYLVTGGAGFIGSHLVDRLLATSSQVVAIDNFDPFYSAAIKLENIAGHLRHPDYRFCEIDLRNQDSLRTLLSNEKFDAILHLGAKAGVRPSLNNPYEYQDVNIGGTLNLLELAREFGIGRFIFASSSSIYGPSATPPFREDSPLLPISPYAATKAAGELLCHTYSHLYDLQVVCLRFFTVYGARQRPDLAIHKFARLIRDGQPIQVYGDGKAQRDFTFIDDILQGILAALDYDLTPFEVINLGESRTISVNRMIELLEEALGKRAIVEHHPPQAGDMPLTHANIDKAIRLLNYNPTTPIEVGIRNFVEWFQGRSGN
jgi:UDP-glucuronate 4-epimerase